MIIVVVIIVVVKPDFWLLKFWFGSIYYCLVYSTILCLFQTIRECLLSGPISTSDVIHCLLATLHHRMVSVS